jgi:hypothetical protein
MVLFINKLERVFREIKNSHLLLVSSSNTKKSFLLFLSVKSHYSRLCYNATVASGTQPLGIMGAFLPHSP